MADAGFDRPSLETWVVGTLSAPSIEAQNAMLAAGDAATPGSTLRPTACMRLSWYARNSPARVLSSADRRFLECRDCPTSRTLPKPC
jgi:hypothetical protein